MRFKKIILALSLFLSFLTLGAQENRPSLMERLRFGIEWGYSQTLFNNYKYTILSAAEGYKMSDNGRGLYMEPHLLCHFNVAYIVNDNISTAIVGGYEGIGESTRVFPLMFRMDWYYDSIYEDGFFSFVEVGPGFQENSGFKRKTAFLAGLGEGYKLCLSSRFSLDLMLDLSFAYDNPPIQNPDGPGYVMEHNILTNFSEYYALSLSLRVNF